MIGLGGLVGLLFGIGVYRVLTAIGPLWARAYVLRIEGYLQPTAEVSRTFDFFVLTGARSSRISARQARAGMVSDPAAHLLRIVTGCVAGLAVGTALVALLGAAGSIHQPLAALPLLAVCGAAGWLLADRRLDVAAKRRREAAVLELPSIAESLAIAVGAGASLAHACELVAERGRGVLSDALTSVVESVRIGGTIDRALATMALDLPVPSVGRFVDAMRIALDRGTPIVDVLHAQASDARNESRRLLMEQAGRREVAMLIPVVFLVLPAVVVISLYPGLRELTSMV